MPILICKICGKEFSVKPSRVKTAKTCGTACNAKWLSRTKVGVRIITKGFKMVNGYKKLYKPDHPRATKKNPYVSEHILVVEAKVGRYLGKNEVVHHINGNKIDNDPNNLLITDPISHNKIHKIKNRKCINHPTKKHAARGLCRNCYAAWIRSNSESYKKWYLKQDRITPHRRSPKYRDISG